MLNKSVWLNNVKFDKPVSLNENMEVDVLIIGGGITGLSTAYHLIQSNLKVCLVEKNMIAHAVTSRTTGKLTYLQENIYSKLKDKAYTYFLSQKEAILMVKNIIKENKIDCDYKNVYSYVYTDNINKIKTLKKEKNILSKLNIKYSTFGTIPINLNCKYFIKVSDTAVFHPIKYLIALKKIIVKNGINVYENSNVTKIEKENDKFICTVNGKRIISNKIVMASHYPFFLFPYLVPLKTSIEKSYISASIVPKANNFSLITVSKPVTSIRYHSDGTNDYLIYLNGSHNLCNKYNYKDNFENLLVDLEILKLSPKYIWSNHDIMTEDHLPYIGYIDDNLLIGTGYNTWGMTNGSLAGKIISDLVLNKKNKYQSLFDPRRNKNLDVFKYPLNMIYSAKSFIDNKIIKNKGWYSDNIKFTKIDGKNVAIYTDKDNKKHIVYNLCPHMKCSLIFNEVEKTWDCPCHGSRFDIDGKCIFGPSNKDIGYKRN